MNRCCRNNSRCNNMNRCCDNDFRNCNMNNCCDNDFRNCNMNNCCDNDFRNCNMNNCCDNDFRNNNMNDCCRNNTNNCNNISKKDLLNKIMSLNFAVNDLVLYLDTHPEDSKAICMHNEYSKEVVSLTEQYQKLYGPLTVNFSSDTWDWIDEPWPWERGAY